MARDPQADRAAPTARYKRLAPVERFAIRAATGDDFRADLDLYWRAFDALQHGDLGIEELSLSPGDSAMEGLREAAGEEDWLVRDLRRGAERMRRQEALHTLSRECETRSREQGRSQIRPRTSRARRRRCRARTSSPSRAGPSQGSDPDPPGLRHPRPPGVRQRGRGLR